MPNNTDQYKHIAIRNLEHTRADSQQKLEGVDPNAVNYEEGNWRVREIIGHLTEWDLEVVRSLKAHAEGGQYLIPDFVDFDAYNNPAADARRNQPLDKLHEDWAEAHLAFKDAIQAMPEERMTIDMRYPWGPIDPVFYLVEIMAGHEREHIKDIVDALNK